LNLVFESIIDFIYPKKSVLTDNKILEDSDNKYWNINDIALLEKSTDEQNEKIKNRLNCDYFYSSLTFDKENYTQKLIHTIKYSGFKNLGAECGKLFGNEVLTFIKQNNISIDYIVPVPLHPVKERERGFNQSSYIAKEISNVCSIPVNNKIIYRIKNTKSQTKLSNAARKQNVKNAFKINDSFLSLIANNNILLLDDVVTTGSTINEICDLLIKNKVNKIFVYTLSSVNS